MSNASKAGFLTRRVFSFAEKIEGLEIYGKPAPYPVVNDRAVRASAGVTFIMIVTSIISSTLLDNSLPVRVFSIFCAIDFLLRISWGMTPFSPLGVVGTLLVRNQRPEWVGATQKRFAWSIGFIVASTVATITNMGMVGSSSLVLCSICAVFTWMEASLGICVGCKIYALFVKSRIIATPDYAPACPGGSCSIPEQRRDKGGIIK